MLDVKGVDALVFNYRDVSERKQSQEKLIASENKFRSLIENSAEGISLLNAHTMLFIAVPGARKCGPYPHKRPGTICPSG